MRHLAILVFGSMVAAVASAQWTPDAETCRTAGTVDERINACTRAIISGQLSTQNLAITFSNRGNAWRSKGENDRAMADYNEAIRLNPQNSIAYTNRGIAWRGNSASDRAIADYTEAVRLDPKNAIAYYNRGIERRGKGDNDRAIADYTEAIRLNPKNSIAYINRGIAWRGKGENGRAIADYTEAIRLDPQNSLAYNNRGTAWRGNGDNDRAIADYNEAIRLNPKNSIAYHNRGRAHFYRGQFAVAEKDFVEADRLKLDAYAVIWLYLTRARGGSNGQAELANDAKRFTTGDWPEPAIRLFLGRLSPESIMSAATNPDSKSQAEDQCEARFFIAEWHLIRGDKKRAGQLFHEVKQACPKPNPDYYGADAELRRLTQ